MSNLTEAEVRAFVGTGAEYYLRKWRPALEGAGNAGNATGFNWAGFLLSGAWLPFRKMYRITAIFLGVLLLETLLEEIVYTRVLGRPEAPGTLGNMIGLVGAMICGGFGNEWYLSHTQEVIAQVRGQGLPEDAYLQELAKRGGTSFAASLGFLAAFAVGVVVIVALTGAR